MSTSASTKKKEIRIQPQTQIRCYCTFKNDDIRPKSSDSVQDNMIATTSRCQSSPNLAHPTVPEPSNGSAPRRNDSSRSSTSSTSTEVIRNITDVPPIEAFSTSSVLHYCKRKILVPYQGFVSLLGWRSFALEEDAGCCRRFGARFYGLSVVIFLLFGYVLQYAACFRRDYVDGYKLYTRVLNASTSEVVVCKGTVVGLYFFPDLLHLAAYSYTYYLLRVCESEQLQTLMERASLDPKDFLHVSIRVLIKRLICNRPFCLCKKVFLQAFYSRSNYITQPKLIRTLRTFLGVSIAWIALSTAVQILHSIAEYPIFTWMKPGKAGEIVLIALLVLSLIWNDVIHVTIIVSYSIQCQLLISFIRGLCERVREKSISLQESIKEIGESAKILKHLNEEFSVSVTLMMLHSGVMSISGIIWAFTTTNIILGKWIALTTNILCLIMWTSIFIFPLIQAARLSAACSCLKKLGQFLLTRPFGYTDVTQQQLDSFLLYTSSLNMQAKLFRIPVNPAVLFTLAAILCFLFLLFTQLNIIKIGF